ncbi:GNAT family N-acetyltransferase [bacterium]|nr:MAG: GNAT family N-acetyltransferase [bacterium]
MTIRPATPADYDALASLKVRAFFVSYRPLLGEDAYQALMRDARAEWFERRVADGHRILVAHEDDRLLGLAIDGPNTLEAPAERELRNVYVDPDLTSRGVGRQLAQASLNAMARDGISSVSLGVFPQNVRAIAFYERLGFVRYKVSTWTNNDVEFADQIMLLALDVQARASS